MAVFPNLLGITVEVAMEGEAMKEYPAGSDEVVHEDPDVAAYQISRTITKYIEAVDDKQFSICLDMREPYQMSSSTLIFVCHVDGRLIDQMVMGRQDYGMECLFKEEIKGPLLEDENGNPLMMPMRFVLLQTTDSKNEKKEELERQTDILESGGQITVQIYHGSRASETELHFRPDVEMVDASREYHQKTLVEDSRTHVSVLDAPTPIEAAETDQREVEFDDDYPVARFVFKYRSTNALKALIVIPRSPSPKREALPPPSSVSGIRSDSIAAPTIAGGYTLEQLAQVAQILGIKPQLKADESAASVKCEATHDNRSPRPRKKQKKYKTQVFIDLTSDDEAIVLE